MLSLYFLTLENCDSAEAWGINHATVSIDPTRDSLRDRCGVVRVCAHRGVLNCWTCGSGAIDHRACVLRRTKCPGTAGLSNAVRGMPRKYDGRHHRTAARRRQFPFQLERAVAGEPRGQDSEDDAVRSAGKPFSTAVDRPRRLY